MGLDRFDLIFKNTKKYKVSVLVGIILIFIQPWITVQIPLKVQYIFDVVLLNKDFDMLLKTFLVVMLLFLIGKIIEYIINLIFYRINCGVAKDIRDELFTNIINAKFSELKAFSTGDLVTRVEDDIKSIRIFFIDTIANVLSNIVTLLISFYMMLQLSITLSVIIALISIVYIFVLKKYSVILDKLSAKYVATIAKSKEVLIEFIENIEVIKLNNNNNFVINKYRDTIENKRDANIKLGNSRITGTFFIETLLNSTPYLIILIGGLSVINGEFSVGAIFAFTEFSKRVLKSLENINTYNFDIAIANVSLNRINKVYKLKGEVEYDEDLFENIILSNVNLQKEGKPILKNITTEILKNDKIAIWGISGSGKTTFSKILLGVEEDYSGEIRSSNKDKYHFVGSYIPSNPYIIKGTLKENILMGKDFNLEAYSSIISLTRLDKFDENHYVFNCSHGEKQKICLARALYSKNKFLIIDEGLSNIDVFDLECIIDDLLKIKDLTILLITHNLDIISKHKQILTFQNGYLLSENFEEFKKTVSSNI